MTLSIAIPDSSLKDETTQVNKTRKISIIARACAIFKVKEIFIYKEKNYNRNDSILISTLLKYLENISAEDIIGLEIPTGQPILLNFEKRFLIGRKYI